MVNVLRKLAEKAKEDEPESRMEGRKHGKSLRGAAGDYLQMSLSGGGIWPRSVAEQH